jgi:hypothetical protein
MIVMSFLPWMDKVNPTDYNHIFVPETRSDSAHVYGQDAK